MNFSKNFNGRTWVDFFTSLVLERKNTPYEEDDLIPNSDFKDSDRGRAYCYVDEGVQNSVSA